MSAEVDFEVRPKLDRNGVHWDKFNLILDGEVVATSRQPYFAGARALIKRGHDPDALMRMHPDAEPFPLSWWARWTVEESWKGLRRREWQPMPSESRGLRV